MGKVGEGLKKASPVGQPESWKSLDRLGRGEVVEQLGRLINSFRVPQVLAVEGAWGMGKTRVIRMLAEQLAESGHPCVYFDAWRHDAAQDPLVPLLATLDAEFDRLAPTGASGKAWKLAKAAGVALAAAAAPVVAGAAIQVAVGATLAKAGKKIIDDVSGAITSAASKAAADLVEQHKREVAAQESFQDFLGKFAVQWAADGGSHKVPLVVFVDELDRCRPTFALELLERIKHAFRTPGVQFVIGVDRSQLGVSVRGEYGEGTDVDGYLRRLVDLWYPLPSANPKAFFNHLAIETDLRSAFAGRDADFIVDVIGDIVSRLAEVFRLPLRTVERVVTQIEVAARLEPPPRTLWPSVLAFYAVMREVDRAQITAYVHGRASAGPLIEFISRSEQGRAFWREYSSANLEAGLRFMSGADSDRSGPLNALLVDEEGTKGEALLELERMKRVGLAIKRLQGAHDAPSAFTREFTWDQLELVAGVKRYSGS